MRQKFTRILFCAALLWAGLARAHAAAAAGEDQKGYRLGTNGMFYLTLPAGWRDKVMHVRENDKTFDAVFLTPADTNQFNLMIEVVGVGGNLTNTEDLRLVLANGGKTELTNSVETSINLKNFSGGQTAGAYFRITDRRWAKAKPPAGEFKFLTRGYATVGPLVVTFALVSNDAKKDEPAALDLLRHATYSEHSPAITGTGQ